MNTTKSTVYVDATVPPAGLPSSSRHCFYRVSSAAGKRFRVAIGLRSNWSSPDLRGWYRLVWTPDPHSDDWREFDSYTIEDEYWIGENFEPFEYGTIYVASLPVFTLTRMQSKVDEWIADSNTYPTLSGGQGYVIGTLPHATGFDGRVLPAFDMRAFRVGTGGIHVALTSGAHPQELGEWFFSAAVDKIMEDSTEGTDLRSTFTFHVYPSINPHGQYGGYVRQDPETGEDANRKWGNSSYSSRIKTVYEAAWAEDLTQLRAHIDYHSAPGRNPVSQSIERELWMADTTLTPSALDDTYAAALAARSTYEEKESTASDAIRNYLNETYGCDVSVVLEHTHANTVGIPEWYQWGRHSVLSLLDIAGSF